jgi:hypothetical protein
MDKVVAQVLQGWMSLSSAQKREFASFIERYEKSGTISQESLTESVRSATKLHTGPLGDTCRCCGR